MHRLGILLKSIWTTMFHPLISIFLVAVVAQVWLQMQKSPLRWCHPMWSCTHSAQDVLPLLSRLPDNWNRCSSGEWAWMSLWRWENKTSTVAILITLFECWQSSYFPGHNRHQYHNSAFNIKSLTWLQFYHTLMMLLHCSSLHLNCGFCNASIPGTYWLLSDCWRCGCDWCSPLQCLPTRLLWQTTIPYYGYWSPFVYLVNAWLCQRLRLFFAPCPCVSVQHNQMDACIVCLW